MERWKVEYAPQSPEDELDDRFVEACQMMELSLIHISQKPGLGVEINHELMDKYTVLRK